MRNLSHSMAGGACAALLLASATCMAAPLSDAQQRYRQERAACMNGTSNQERATCLREAGAALQEARGGGLSGGGTDLGRNRALRCASLPTQDRDDCVMRMNGEGSTSGSAMQGGVLRELERPAPPRSN